MRIKNDFPLLIINFESESEEDLLQYCRSWIENNINNNLHEKLNIEEIKLLDEEELTAKSIQEILLKSQLSINHHSLRVIYFRWTDKLKTSGNYNKLLKLFEEPNANTLIILLNKSFVLPQTIKSRGIVLNDFADGIPSIVHKIKHEEENQEKNNLYDIFQTYLNEEISPFEFTQILKQRKTETPDFLKSVIETLISRQLSFQKCETLGKIINNYNQNKNLNLNNFDNIIIALKLCFKEDNIFPNKN